MSFDGKTNQYRADGRAVRLMARKHLSQTEADSLLAMEKRYAGSEITYMRYLGQKETIDLHSVDKSEKFVLDLNRGRYKLRQVSMQTRARVEIVLARIDLHGPTHRNPDDTHVPTPHLHIYREGYWDRWAIPIPISHFTHQHDDEETLRDFMRFCNITRPPQIQLMQEASLI